MLFKCDKCYVVAAKMGVNQIVFVCYLTLERRKKMGDSWQNMVHKSIFCVNHLIFHYLKMVFCFEFSAIPQFDVIFSPV